METDQLPGRDAPDGIIHHDDVAQTPAVGNPPIVSSSDDDE